MLRLKTRSDICLAISRFGMHSAFWFGTGLNSFESAEGWLLRTEFTYYYLTNDLNNTWMEKCTKNCWIHRYDRRHQYMYFSIKLWSQSRCGHVFWFFCKCNSRSMVAQAERTIMRNAANSMRVSISFTDKKCSVPHGIQPCLPNHELSSSRTT